MTGLITLIKKKNKQNNKIDYGRLADKISPYLFISPFYISFLIFFAFPILYSLFLSFQRWNGVREMKFIFLKNYLYLLTDPEFYQSLFNTIVMLVIALVIQHALALYFAFILNQGLIRLKDLFKGLLFIPYTTSTVAIALIFGVIYGTHYGLLNYLIDLLNSVGLMNIELPIFWLKGTLTWFSIIFLASWKWVGWNTILYMAGLQSIPNTTYEAAKVDGAGWVRIFFQITIPILKPIIFLATTATIIGGMQMFDEPMILLRGESGLAESGNYGLTTTFYIYRSAFSYSKFGIAAAASYLLVLVILVLSWMNRLLWGEKQIKKQEKPA